MEKNKLKPLEETTFGFKALLFIFSLILFLFGLFMLYVWGGNIWDAISEGYVRMGGSVALRMSPAHYYSGFGFWMGIFLSLMMLLLGLILFLSGVIGLTQVAKLFLKVLSGLGGGSN